MARDDMLAQIEHALRTGELYIAELRHAIALEEREGRDCRRDRGTLAHLETARQILIESRRQLLSGAQPTARLAS